MDWKKGANFEVLAKGSKETYNFTSCFVVCKSFSKTLSTIKSKVSKNAEENWGINEILCMGFRPRRTANEEIII